MADISKCTSINCPYERSCYRKLAKDNEWQSYVDFQGCGCDEGSGFSSYISKGVCRND